MADTIKDVIIRFKTSGEVDVKKSFSDLELEAKAIRSEYAKQISALDPVADKQKILSLRLEETSKYLNQEKDRLSVLKEKLAEASNATEKNEKVINGLKIAVNNSEMAVNKYSKELTNLSTNGTRSLSNLEQKTKDAEKETKKLGDTAKNTGGSGGLGLLVGGAAAAATAFVGMVAGLKGTLDSFRQMESDAKKASMSLEGYQVMSKVFKQNNVDAGVLQTTMSKLTKQINQTDEEGDQATSTLSALGVAVNDSSGNLRKSEDVYKDAIKALMGISNETERNIMAQKLFGKSYSELNPILDLGAQKFDEVSNNMKKTIMTPEQIQSMKEASQKWDTMQNALNLVKNQLIAVMVPAILPYIQQLTTFVTENRNQIVEWIQNAGHIAKTLAPIAGVILGIIAALQIYNGILAIVGVAEGIWNGIKVAGTAIQWLWNVALSANPIGLIIIAIVAIIGVLVLLWNKSETFRNIVMGIIGAIGAVFNWLKDIIVGAITWAIDSAKKNFEILYNFLKPIIDGVVVGFNWLKDNIVKAIEFAIGFVQFYFMIWWAVVSGVINGIITAFNWLKDIIVGAIEWAINTAINNFNMLVNAVNWVVGKITGFFGGIGDAVSGLIRGAVNAVIGFINNVIWGVNTAIGVINKIPGVSVGFIPQLGYMATGGTLISGTAIVGEAGPELLYNTSQGAKVIPLSSTEKAQGISGKLGGGAPETLNIDLGDFKLVAKLKERINDSNTADYMIAKFGM